jgi:hypothetical protein
LLTVPFTNSSSIGRLAHFAEALGVDFEELFQNICRRRK